MAGNDSQGARNDRRCLMCGTQLAESRRGRQRKFCSTAHRVAYHRRKKRPSTVQPAPSTVPPAISTPPCGPTARWRALEAVLDAIDDVESLGGAARLRQLAERADQVVHLVDEVRAQSWALDDLDDIGPALDTLTWLGTSASTVAELDDVADAVDELALAIREIRRHRAELEDAVNEARDAVEVGT